MRKPLFLKIFLIVFTLTSFFGLRPARAVSYTVDWQSETPHIQIGPVSWTAFDVSRDQTKMIVAENPGRLYISTDSGNSWGETQPLGNQDANWRSVSISDDGQTILAAVMGGRLYLSIDAGANWTEEQPNGDVDQNWQGVALTYDGTVGIAIVSSGRVYKLTVDHGTTGWTQTYPIGDADGNWSSVQSYGRRFFLAANPGRLYTTPDIGDSWEETQPLGDQDVPWSSFTGVDGPMIATSKPGRVFIFDSGAVTWTELQPAGDTDKNWGTSAINSDASTILVGEKNGRVYYSKNIGESWEETEPAGSVNQSWFDAAINDDGSSFIICNGTTAPYIAAVTQTVPDAPNNFSTVSNTSSNVLFNGLPVFQTTELRRSQTNIFSQAHGNVQIGDKLYIGTRTSPAKLVVFNNPDDFSDYSSVSVAGLASFESMAYDSIHHRIYATAWNGAASQNLTIYSFNPDNLNEYSVVVNEPSLPDSGSPAIATDGEYVYGATYAFPPKIFKYRISDWSLVASKSWIGGPASAHAAKLHKYNNRTEIYITAALGTSSVIKVNGSDLSYSEHNFGATLALTDDMAFQYINEEGGILYLGSETSDTMYQIDTRTMIPISATASRTYGIFFGNNNLYVLGNQGYITKFIDHDLGSPRIYRFSGEVPNEMYLPSSGKTIFSNWSIPGYLKEYGETENLLTASTVTINWEETLSGVTFDPSLSTNGVDYSTVEMSDPLSPTITLSNLSPNTHYWLKIVAINGSQSSTPGIYEFTTASFTPAALPSVPSFGAYSATQHTISVQWSGSNSEYYTRINTNNSGWTSATNYTFSNLSCGTSYPVYLKSRNADKVESAYVQYAMSTAACSGGSSSTTPRRIMDNANPRITPEPKPEKPPLPDTETSNGSGTTTEKAFVFRNNLWFGLTHQDVKALQKYLNAQGFTVAQKGPGSKGKETTFFGAATRKSLAAFQRAKKIKPSAGFFGAITRAFINTR